MAACVGTRVLVGIAKEVAVGEGVLAGKGIFVGAVGRAALVSVGITLGIGILSQATRPSPKDVVPHSLRKSRRERSLIFPCTSVL